MENENDNRKYMIDIFNYCSENNFEKIKPYLQYELKIFKSLDKKIFEVCKCLMLESYTASITLTNFVVERLLKIALIENAIGERPQDANLWNDLLQKPHEDYSNKSFSQSIDHCLKLDLITKEERDYLYDFVRDMFRNGFSHSETDKILVDYENQTTLKIDSVVYNFNPKLVPFMQFELVDDFTKRMAYPYFEFVYKLIFDIEQRVIAKRQ